MELAALIIACMALMAATASLTLQIAIWKLDPRATQPARSHELDQPSDYELGLAKEQSTPQRREVFTTIQADQAPLDEAFDPPFMGIDDEFGIS